MKRLLSSLPFVRPLFLKCLRATAFDIQITNPWTRDRLFLNTYNHKGYWYFGRSREEKTMRLFERYISKGDLVVEVGGHIGFITQYFSHLVGDKGKVVVFEPGSNNLPYLERNVAVLNNVVLERKAVSNTSGTATFYEDNITGQNNSLLSDYKNARAVAKSHHDTLKKTARKVELITLDNYLSTGNLSPDFVKIDIEGHELQALEGMTAALDTVPRMMIEVTENQRGVSEILTGHGYEMRDEAGRVHDVIPHDFSGNIFAVKHNQTIAKVS